METKIYVTNVSLLDNPSLFSFFYNQMPEERRKKIDAFRFQKDKNLSLAAGILLQKACRENGFSEIPIMAYKNDGKPYFPQHPFFQFNLSHSEDMAMCIVSEQSVGCDIERIKEPNFSIANRFFSKKESMFLEKSTDPTNQFYELWTCKESFMKCVGLGFALPMSDFSVEVCPSLCVSQNVTDKEYSLFLFHEISQYALACCIEGKQEKPKLEIVMLPKEGIDKDEFKIY